MYIKGIGKVKKQEVLSIMTRDGMQAVRNGDITLQEAGSMYKLEMVKRASRIGKMSDAFRASYKWIPDDLKDCLSPQQLAKLTDQFYECYGAGKNA